MSALGRKLRLSHPTQDYRAATEGEDVLAIAHFQLGRFADALIAARRAIDLAPEFSVPHAHIAAALVRLGRVEEAKAAARQLLALQPTFTICGFATTVNLSSAVFAPFAKAWEQAGLPL